MKGGREMIEHVYTKDRGHYTRRAPSNRTPLPKLPGVKYDPTSNPKKPWKCCLEINGKSVYIGHYATPQECSAAYRAARKLHPPCRPGRPRMPHEKRQAILDTYRSIGSQKATAEACGVNVKTVQRLLKERGSTKEVNP
jgi:hypothetical protein